MRTQILVTGCLCVCLSSGSGWARDKSAKVLVHPPYDPEAARIDLFEGIDLGRLKVEMKPRDEHGGSLFVENLTAQPLTVELPEVLVGVQVVPQVGVQFPLPGGVGQNGNQPQQFGSGQGQGQNQPVGGTANGNPAGPGTGNNAIPGLFSVPAERVVRIAYTSVCLEHGAKEPRSGNVYRLVKVDKFSKDERLTRLLQRVGQPGENAQALQAAAWHIANDMTWDELVGKRRRHLNAPSEPFFARQDLQSAYQIVSELETLVAADGGDAPVGPPAADKSLGLIRAGG